MRYMNAEDIFSAVGSDEFSKEERADRQFPNGRWPRLLLI